MVQKSSELQIVSFQRDLRNTSRMRLTQRNHALLYGHRPMAHRELKYLSPYEFTMYWEPQLLKYPTTLEENASGLCHAILTPVGECKVRLPGSAELVPVIDYVKMSILFLLYISHRKILSDRGLKQTAPATRIPGKWSQKTIPPRTKEKDVSP